MARHALAGTFGGGPGEYTTRVTVSRKPSVQPVLEICSMLTETEARERSRDLAAMAGRLRKAGVVADAPRALRIAARSRPGEEYGNACNVIDALCGGKAPKTTSNNIPTVETFAKQWTSGELARKWPDHVKEKKTWERDKQRFDLYINKQIGPVRMDRFTLNHAETVMTNLPAKMAPKTRQAVGQLLHRLVSMAVYPGRYLQTNPIPRGWLPKPDKRKAMSCLYPSEDAALLAAPANLVPLEQRLIFGVLAREGMREGELAALRWRDVNLEVGAVNLDQNKTDDPRTWALNPGVARALKTWKERYRPDAEPDDFVVGEGQRPVSTFNMAEYFRDYLRAAGVTRAELFERSKTRIPIRVHDLRATFVTVSLANGRTEAWVMDRTGHTTSGMLNKYRRQARTWGELSLGTLASLDVAIPELLAVNAPGAATDLPQDCPKRCENPLKTWCEEGELNAAQQIDKSLASQIHGQNHRTAEPAQPVKTPSEQSGEQSDALDLALLVAAKAGDATTVARIVELMTARQRGANVVDLASRKAKL